MKSWKTTLGGLLAAFGIGLKETGLLSQYAPLIEIMGLTLLGISARDNNVPSEAIPGAVAKQTEIAFRPPGKP